jgi:hypothetical protein
MSEFKINRLRYTWEGSWETDTVYKRDSVVEFQGKSYVCIEPHTSTNFFNDLEFETPAGEKIPRWTLMIDGRTWRDNWLTDTIYYPGNIVRYNGVVYIATEFHTSQNEIDLSNWAIYTELDLWDTVWQTNKFYSVGDIIRYGGIVYRCKFNHTSASSINLGLEIDLNLEDSTLTKWEVFFEGIEYIGDWNASSFRYKKNDVVRNGSDLWISKEGHISSTTFDLSKWNTYIPGVEFLSTWNPETVYQTGDVVIYGGYSYSSRISNNVNIVPSLNAAADDSTSAWEIVTKGYDFKNSWTSNDTYLVGDVIRRGGNLYTAIIDNINQDPISFTVSRSYSTSSTGTTLVVSTTENLVPGMVITGTGFRNGQTIARVVNSTTLIISEPPTSQPSGDILFSGINYIVWELLVPGVRWRNIWLELEEGNTYLINDIVVWKSLTYLCVKNHSTISGSRPDLDTNGEFWVIYLSHDKRNAGEIFGDMVVFSGELNRAGSFGIGLSENSLVVDDNYPSWREVSVVDRAYYVSLDGIDTATSGQSLDNTFRTIKYAAEFIDKGIFFQNTGFLLDSNRDFLAVEVYEWMIFQKQNNTPPFSTTSEFDEFSSKRDVKYIIDALVYDLTKAGNSQTVAAALAYFALEKDGVFKNQATTDAMPFIVASLNYLYTLVPSILNNQPITSYQAINGVPLNNVITQTINADIEAEPSSDSAIDALLNGIIIDSLTLVTKKNIPPPNQKLTSTILVKTGTYFEDLPIVIPANTALVGEELRSTVVRPNKAFYTETRLSNSSTNKFLLASTAGIEVGMPIQFSGERSFGGITLGQTYYVSRVDSIGISLKTSLELEEEVELESSVGLMLAFGGQCLSDMFYVQNGTGIRNMTLAGLGGTLTDLNQYLTRRTTGGAYVGLDPGRGPDDTRAWIYRKSPYIQNVTNFGFGCVGCKIDATLHNGGNKSMVSNDFTQVLSDGIGIWCTGEDSLTEAVSVFSYYCYAGYLAEDGGRIRATNGNSSYGTFGVVAEGFVLNESPITGKVNNRSTQIQASVQSSFGSNAELVKVQYLNSGNNYTTQTTNLLRFSNDFNTTGVWNTDGNTTLQRNLISPRNEANAWTLNGLTSGTDSAYIYQDIEILPTGATYLSVAGTNITGSGIGATFNIQVTATGYIVTVASGGSGYVVGNQILIPGIILGGVSGVNDCIIQVTGLTGSTITAVVSSGIVPAGSVVNYVYSIHCKKVTAEEIFLYAIFDGNSLKASGISFNFDTQEVTTFSSTGGGNEPIDAGVVVLKDGWYRVWFVVNDADGLNNSLQFRVYPRGKFGNTGATGLFGAQLTIGNSLTFYSLTKDDRYVSYADFSVVGAGINARPIGDELRSQAVFQTRVIPDENNQVGGRGFLVTTNNGQGGTNTTFTIAGSDTNSEANLLGMRIFINSGTGAGQYGYISSLSPITKVVRVLKESFESLEVSSVSSNEFQLASNLNTDSLYPDMEVQFISTFYNTVITETSRGTAQIFETVGGTDSVMLIENTRILRVNMPVEFEGEIFGGVIDNFTYFVKEIISETEFSLSTQINGPLLPLNNEVGAMAIRFPSNTGYLFGSTEDMLVNLPIVFTGTTLGGLSGNLQYFINDVIDENNFTVSGSLINLTISATDVSGTITTSDTAGMVVYNPIIFTGNVFGNIVDRKKYYISRVISPTLFTISEVDDIIRVEVTSTEAVTNLITVTSTSGFSPNRAIKFTGNLFGGLQAEFVYFILAINDGTTFTVSTTVGGSAVLLSTSVGQALGTTSSQDVSLSSTGGSMIAKTTSPKILVTTQSGTMISTFRTEVFGGVNGNDTYYIKDINQTSFTVSETPGGTVANIINDSGSMQIAAVGWDHINSGTPIPALLDSSSIYFIEPRIIYQPPPFIQTAGGALPVLAGGLEWGKISYGNGFWMAIADGGNAGARSSTGTSWSTINFPITADWTDIVYGNSYWVVVSSGGGDVNSKALYSSSNGSGWRVVDLPGNKDWVSLTYGNGKFITVANKTDTIGYSENFGGTWNPSRLTGRKIDVFGDAKISTTQSRFGGSSLALDGNGDFIRIRNIDDLGFGTDDFTIEFWIYRTGTLSESKILYDQRTAATDPFVPVIGITTGNQIFYGNGDGTISITSAATVALNTWTHVAVVRNAGNIRAYMAGTQTGSVAADNNTYKTNPVTIGSRYDGTGSYAGFIDDFRISKGIARYTANFTPSTTEFEYDDDTTVLIPFDGTNNSTFISTIENWSTVCYGAGVYVAIASGKQTASFSTDGINWTGTQLPFYSDWKAVTFGNSRFVAISESLSRTAYSFDGNTWYSSDLSIEADSIAYGQGVFVASKVSSETAYSSEDGIYWKKYTISLSNYKSLSFGYTAITNVGIFVTVPDTGSSTVISAGARAKGRPNVISSTLQSISMWESGSGYFEEVPPEVTIVDPNVLIQTNFQVRIGSGSLGNPTFFNRGLGYNTTSTAVKVFGDGFADQYQVGFTLICSDITKLPSPGDNLQLDGNPFIWKVTSSEPVFGTSEPNLEININVAPEISIFDSPEHDTPLTIRTKYSQVRLTNHDFLNIGFGNEKQANYPKLPTETVLSPQNQTVETNNGRVFYTTSDQDGNFNVGNLFGVEQATGIVTISATQFDLGGLDQLTIGGISVGGNAVVVRQFSTDPTFVANSNEIIPTQRAIRAYLSSRLSQGGSNTFTGELTAGTVVVGGPDRIRSTVPQGITGHQIRIPVRAVFDGNQAAWAGDGLAYSMFTKSFWRRGDFVTPITG